MANLRDVIGYEGLYKVTSDGKIWSIKSNKFLKLNFKKNGYVYVELNKNGVGKTLRVHRIVAESFIDNPENKKTVNHKNGVKSDNRVSNLEWMTVQENTIHAYENGMITPATTTYILYNQNDEITINGGKKLQEETGYGSSQLAIKINNNEMLYRGKFKGWYIRRD